LLNLETIRSFIINYFLTKPFLMKSIIFSILAATFFVQLSFAQKATIVEKKILMKTYMFSDPNPVPDMEKNYPYFKFDGYTNTATQQEWNMVVLENDYIKVYVNTDVGGKIWGAIEKSTGKEFLYYNDVVKFRDVAHRGAWTSGGLEFNFGIMSHVSTCATPQDYVIKENADGSVSCVIGAIDLHTGTKWNVEINLQKDRAYVETRASWFNTGNLPVSSYHFSNAAAKADGNLEFIYPGDHYIGHQGEVGDWPVENGREISFYNNNNFGSYKSYHVLNGYANFMGGYYHNDDFGFGNIRNYDEMPGKKLWIWGLADEGMIWEDLLTDTKGQYIEFQTGSMFNQAMSKSSLTPFKHREFIPYDSDLSTELWFPLKETGGMVAATKYAVLNVERKNKTLAIRLSALTPLNTELVVKAGGKKVSTKVIKLQPLELTTLELQLEEKQDFTVELGNYLLFYSSKKEEVIVDRPLEANKDFDWDSAEGLFTKGIELEKLQSFTGGGQANRKAHNLYLKSLQLNPAYAPALNRLAFSFYRRMQYEQALQYTLKSLAINTYDAEANYLFGIINAKLGKTANAKSGFSIAAKSTTYRTAGYTELAKLYLQKNRYERAIEFSNKALAFNTYNVVALEIQAVAYRLKGEQTKADNILVNLYALDNTSAFVTNEQIISGKNPQKSLTTLITNELPAESYIQLALKYKTFGRINESVAVLKAGPKQVTLLLLLAYLDVENRDEWLTQGLNESPELVFPYRTQTYEALTELIKTNNSWQLKYYASLVLWKKDLYEQAKELINQCGDQPDFAPFYLAKAKLFSEDKGVVKASLSKAKSLAPNDWHVNLALIEQYMKDKEYTLAAKYAKSSFAKNPERSMLGMRYADALLKEGKLKKGMAFLDKFEVIPFEGAVEGRQIYHETAIRLAFEAFKKKEYSTAIKYVNKATVWPTNIGTGKPFNADERLENAIISYCYQKMGNTAKADEYRAKLVAYQVKDDQIENSMLYLQVEALKGSGKEKEATLLTDSALKEDSGNEYVRWVKSTQEEGYPGNEWLKKLKQTANSKPLDNSFLLLLDYLDIIKNN